MYAWVFQMIWTQNLGLICINLRFMHIFLRLRSVLTLLSFDCRFEYFGLSFRRKARSWGQLSQESSKTSPIGPEHVIQGESSEHKRSSKRSVQEATESERPETTMVGPWYSPRTVVRGERSCFQDAWPCIPPAHMILRFLAWMFIFHGLFQFELFFWL